MPKPNVKKLNLSRTYTHSGKDYGPGVGVEVPETVYDKETGASAASDIEAKEQQYQDHLRQGGEPAAPITPSVAGNLAAEPEGKTALPPPRPVPPPAPAQATAVAGAAPAPAPAAAVQTVAPSAATAAPSGEVGSPAPGESASPAPHVAATAPAKKK